MTGLASYVSQEKSLIQARIKPVWVDNAHKYEDKFIRWFEEFLPISANFSQYRIYQHWNNLLWFTGEILDLVGKKVAYPNYAGFKDQARKVMPFWFNHIWGLTEKRGADLEVLRPDFETFPTNAEESDRISARIMKVILDHIKRFNGLPMSIDENETRTCMFGESFIGVDWDERIGDKVKGSKGWKKEGEVKAYLIEPWKILPLPANTWGEVKCAIQVLEILDVDEARRKYNDPGIEAHPQTTLFDFGSPWEYEVLPHQVVIYRTIYKPDEFLPYGLIALSTRKKTLKLEFEKYRYSHDDFPWERHTDIDVPGRCFPMSIYRHLKPIQWTYNVLSGMIKRNIFFAHHPKWMMVKGSCNPANLGNTAQIVEHRLGQQPELKVFPTVGGEAFNFRGSIKQEMDQLAGSHPLSRGEVPANTRSGIQISRLQNIEKQGRSRQINKRNDFMRRLLLKCASVAADYYPTTSERRVTRIVGKENAIDVITLKDVKISSQYDITIQNSTGFSDDLVGRLEEIAFARQQTPGLLSPQQELDIIGIRSPQKYYDIPTASLRTAEAENEMMSEGRDVPAPHEGEDHIIHWTTHVIDMQTMTYKRQSEKIKELKRVHLEIHEEMMETLAQKNPLFKQRLMTLDRYPIFFVLDPDRAAIEQQLGIPQAAPMPLPPPPGQGQNGQQGPPPPKNPPTVGESMN